MCQTTRPVLNVWFDLSSKRRIHVFSVCVGLKNASLKRMEKKSSVSLKWNKKFQSCCIRIHHVLESELMIQVVYSIRRMYITNDQTNNKTTNDFFLHIILNETVCEIFLFILANKDCMGKYKTSNLALFMFSLKMTTEVILKNQFVR